MELLEYFPMILAVFNKEYTEKASMEVLVHFLMSLVYIYSGIDPQFLHGAPGLFPYDSDYI